MKKIQLTGHKWLSNKMSALLGLIGLGFVICILYIIYNTSNTHEITNMGIVTSFAMALGLLDIGIFFFNTIDIEKLKSSYTRFINNNHAQLTIPGIFLIFLGLMVLSAIMPMITSTTTNMSLNLSVAGYAEESIISRLIPLAIIVVFLSGIAMYGEARR